MRFTMSKNIGLLLVAHLIVMVFVGEVSAQEVTLRYTIYKTMDSKTSSLVPEDQSTGPAVQVITLHPGAVVKRLHELDTETAYAVKLLEPARLAQETGILWVDKKTFNQGHFTDGDVHMSVGNKKNIEQADCEQEKSGGNVLPTEILKQNGGHHHTKIEKEQGGEKSEDKSEEKIGLAEADKAAESLRKLGYRVFPIRKDLQIIHSPGIAINEHMMNKKCDVLMNATYYYRGKPVSWVYDGSADTANYESSWTNQRGFLAKFNDGSVELGIIGQEVDPSSSGIKAHLEKKYGKQLTGFVGGGGYIVKPDVDGKGVAVTSKNLLEEQNFRQGGSGIGAAQFRHTNHALVASIKGHAFAVVNSRAKDGMTLQTDFIRAGFDKVVKFDGGSGLFLYKRGEGYHYGGPNYSGLCVQLYEQNN